MSVCGLWQGPHRLVAVVVDGSGVPVRAPLSTPAKPHSAMLLLTYLAGTELDCLILAEHSHTLVAQARRLNLRVRLAPQAMFEAIRTAAGLNHRPPRHSALLLARWPSTPWLRQHLRECRPPAPHFDQLTLF